jgi:sec-independent protein translocase protein TatA
MDMDWPALLIIFLIVLVLFGGKRLPGLGKSIGQSIRGFKSGLNGSKAQEPPLAENDDQPTPAVAPLLTATASPGSPPARTAQPPAPDGPHE